MKSVLSFIFIFCLLPPSASAKNINLRYILSNKGIFDLNLGRHFTLGAAYQSLSSSAASTTNGVTTSEATASLTLIGARGTIHLQGRGMADGWYLAGEAGTVTWGASRKASGATEFKGDKSGAYYGAFIGYHWFWSVFNLNLGYGAVNWGVDSLSITDGTTIETYTNLPKGYSGLELGFGLAF